MQTLLVSTTALQLERILIPGTSVELYCDTSSGKPCPYVPSPLRRQIFNYLHSLSHPVIKATAKLISQSFVWTAALGGRSCQPCQRSKVSRHITAPVGNFTLPPARFLHVYNDIVGPLPSSAGFQYCPTAVDRFTRWPETFPIPDITPEAVSRALLSGLIAFFGCPETITTEQGRRFEPQLFHSRTNMCDIHLSRTTPHHPAANGLVKRLHRTLKAVIMYHADEQWTAALPLVLLGIRTAYKEDLQSSTAQLVYGEHLRVPGELLVPAAPKMEASTFIQQLRRLVDQLRPTPAARHASPAKFVHKYLRHSTHVFLRETPHAAPWRHHTVARTR